MTMSTIADFTRLEQAITRTQQDLRNGTKTPDRARKAELRVIGDLASEVATGEFTFRVDAGIDAGGGALHPRPMDYVIGGMLSCQEMWCMRWAALTKTPIANLKITAVGRFTWRGEYLEEVDSGLTLIETQYHVTQPDLRPESLLEMADMVARRCPVFATLRKSTIIEEQLFLNGKHTATRQWIPGKSAAVPA
jgi:uncharacterized OsmC-like protein